MKRPSGFGGKVALVSGGASGIGLAVARGLRKEGASVVLLDADRHALARCRRWQDRADLVEVDVSDPVAVRAAVDDAARRHGRIDLLVAAAGICRDAVLWKMSDEQWGRVIDVDLSGAGNLLRAAARHLRAEKRPERGGRIVLISSVNGRRGKFGQATDAAAKAGLVGLARSAARELGGAGVTVNVIEPGFTETPMTKALPAEVRARALSETLLGRIASADDIAAAVLFLLGAGAAHITGQVLAVDGGQALG